MSEDDRLNYLGANPRNVMTASVDDAKKKDAEEKNPLFSKNRNMAGFDKLFDKGGTDDSKRTD